MAYLKVRHRVTDGFSGGKYHDDDAVHHVLHYVTDPQKTPSGYIGGIAVNPQQAILEMEALSRYYGQDTGVRLRHFILSFRPRELWSKKGQSLYAAYQVACAVAQFYGEEYQIVYAVHENTRNPHIHFVMNTTNYRTGLKYQGKKQDLHNFLNWINEVLEPYGRTATLLKDDGDWQYH